jgi:hypothetical protein
MKYEGIQPLLRESHIESEQLIGKYGCLWLSYLQEAGYNDSLLDIYNKCLDKGFIDRECFVLWPQQMLEMLTNKKCQVWKEEASNSVGGQIKHWKAFNGDGSHFTWGDVDTETRRNRILLGYRRVEYI